jgi:hypothetical protein
MADDERRAKRSRFDQTEPEPRRASRFDRRSRSPSSRQPESTRTRSPLSREPYSPGADDSRKSGSVDPAAAAAAAAAKINAQLQAKKGIQHVDVPPIRSVRNRDGPVLMMRLLLTWSRVCFLDRQSRTERVFALCRGLEEVES